MNHNKFVSKAEKVVSATIVTGLAGVSLSACGVKNESPNGVYCSGGDKIVAVKGDTLTGMLARNASKKLTGDQAFLAAQGYSRANDEAAFSAQQNGTDPKPITHYNYTELPNNPMRASEFNVYEGTEYIIPKCQPSGDRFHEKDRDTIPSDNPS